MTVSSKGALWLWVRVLLNVLTLSKSPHQKTPLGSNLTEHYRKKGVNAESSLVTFSVDFLSSIEVDLLIFKFCATNCGMSEISHQELTKSRED